MKYAFALLLFPIVIFPSCKKNPVMPDQKTTPIVLPPNGAEVVAAGNQFAFDFFHATLNEDVSEKNKLVSPLSIYLALSMVYNGADHATKDSMDKALRLHGIDINTLNAVCSTFVKSLPGEDNRVQINIANSIWYRNEGYQPYPSFLGLVQNSYDAEIKPLDFADPNSVNMINKWVAEKTKGKIPRVLDQISPDDLMFLINAIYFNGKWKHAFKASNTRSENFYANGVTPKPVPFMIQKMVTPLYSDENITIAELPYGGGNSFSMYILMPNGSQSLKECIANLNPQTFRQSLEKMDSSDFEIHLPRWEYSYELPDMKPELSGLGMGIAFTPQADFSKIYDETQTRVQITKAIHKTYIKVNEEGTEAAAVTVIGIGMTAMPQPRILKIDHPFVYAIVEKQTDAVLFLGTVNDPSAN